MFHQSVYTAILVIILSITAHSQQTRQYTFKQFSVINGLASNTVSMVAQDNDGYIWMATVNGLQRYDGSSFITFKSKTSDPTSIPSNHIVVMYVDRNKNLWLVGGNNKVGIFDTKKFEFREAGLPPEKQKYYIKHFFIETDAGDLILHKEDGSILQYDQKKHRFVKTDLVRAPQGWVCTNLTWDHHVKKFWLSCNQGIAQYDPYTKRLIHTGNNPGNDPVIQALEGMKFPSELFVTKKGDILFHYWFPNAGGPTQYIYNRSRNKLEVHAIGVHSYHEIFGYLQQRNGRVWIYGLPFMGEWNLEENRFEYIKNKINEDQSLEFDYPFSVFEDKENNIWIATDNGVFLFNPDAQIFNLYNLVRKGKIVDAPVTCVEETKDGKIFVGVWGSSGIFCYDRNFNPQPLPKVMKAAENLSVWDMATNKKTNDLWITLQGGGIALYKQENNQYDYFYPEIFAGSTIRQVDEDTSGNMWFGTQNGKVIKWDYKKSGGDPRKGYELIYRSGLVQKIHYDYQGYVWVGTLGYGLLKINAVTHKLERTFTSTGRQGERLFADSPLDMTYYNDSTLIVAAGGLNIINTKTNKVRFITTDEGLPSNTASSVEKDERGIIWIGMANGICRLNLEKNLLTYYDRRDGMAYDKFIAAGVKELKDGRLVYFTAHNFLVFNPLQFGQQIIPPKVHITDFKLAGQTLSLDSINKSQRAILKYNNTSIAISFSALSYMPQQKKHFYYMLEGLDRDWIRTDKPVEVIYNYLRPGEYIFKVKTENADGQSNPEIATLAIEVRPPFWKTWWFYSLVVLLVILVLYLIDRERMKKLRSMQQLRTQIASNLHGEINTALNNINVLSEIAKIKADRNVEQSKEFIDKISDRSRNMIESMDDMLWSIDPENDSMKKTLARIKELTEGIQAEYNVDIDLIVDNKLHTQELDMKLRHELYFYFKEAMSFIVTHSHCHQKFVNMNLVRSRLILEILSECKQEEKDFEERFRKAIQNRVKSMNGNLDVISDSKSFAAILVVQIK